MAVNPELIHEGLKVWAYPGRAQEGLKGVVKSKAPSGPTYCTVVVEVTVPNPFVSGQEIKQTLHLTSRQITRRHIDA